MVGPGYFSEPNCEHRGVVRQGPLLALGLRRMALKIKYLLFQRAYSLKSQKDESGYLLIFCSLFQSHRSTNKVDLS